MMDSGEKVIEVRSFEGNLVVFPPDAPGSEVDIYLTGPDTFQSPKLDIRIVFKRDATGVVVGCTVYQDGAFEFVRF